ncbi:Multifunctional conjugation protein TraI [Acaryochloris thomasi RCC1774]|uniref:Multifunctional conjugation protein TraI n=1 Tax=Acaryochloris thomasi RCC1774 TaxID=1764569 RepID=A0A2W1JG25_9CYAN|nr:MobF family relaxase [Acaryochloris thomasi]PZD70605.1 Multifunctional conjugation protein TraI [Acaryochloris thomasi RCC1774]
MLTAHNVRPEAAASYYEQEDSYYAQEENACGSRWYGNLAAQVCLEGAVEAEDFRRFIHGRAPNGVRLRGVSNAGNKTRGGYDLTFSAPKSVSLQALVWNDTRVIKAHREAVDAVLKEIELNHSLVEIRTGGKRQKEITGKLAIATFTHATSRKMDPQLHTHAIIMNTSYCSDGKWRALRNESFFRDSRRDLGVRYQHELAANLQQIGYGIVWKPNDTFDITGYTKEQLRAFSQRTVEIEAIAQAKGVTGWRELKHISLQNRPVKELEEPQKLKQQWHDRAQGVDLQNPRLHIVQENVVSIPVREEQQGIERTTAEKASTVQPTKPEDINHGRTTNTRERDQAAEPSHEREADGSREAEPNHKQAVGDSQRTVDVSRATESALDPAQSTAQREQRSQTQEGASIGQSVDEYNASGSQRASDGVHRSTERSAEGQEERRPSPEHQAALRKARRFDDPNQRRAAQQRLDAGHQSRLDGAVARLSGRVEAARANGSLITDDRSTGYGEPANVSRDQSDAALKRSINELANDINTFNAQEVLAETLPGINQALEKLGLTIDKSLELAQEKVHQPDLSSSIDSLADAISHNQAEAVMLEVGAALGERLQHLSQNHNLVELADAIQTNADLQVIAESGLGEKLQELASVVENQRPSGITFEGIEELAEVIHSGDIEQTFAESLPLISETLDALQLQIDQSLTKGVADHITNAVGQWTNEQRMVEAMAAGDQAQVMELLREFTGPSTVRPQVQELAEALHGWQEQQLIAEVAAEFSGVMDRLRGQHGIEQLAEVITKQQAMEQVAEVITEVSGRLEQWMQYPQMAELAELIQQQADVGTLLESGLTDKLNHVGHSLEQMTRQQPSLEGVQELAKAIHETQQQDAIAEHMQVFVGLGDHVENWIEQQADVQRLALLVQTLRSNPEVSREELQRLTEQMRNMGIDVTPKPQKKAKPVVEKPVLKKDRQPTQPPTQPQVEKPVLKKDRLEAEAQVANEAPQQSTEKTGRVWTTQRLQALEYLRPTYIEKERWVELVKDSSIHPQVAAKYFWSLDGPGAKEHLLNYAMGQFAGHGTQYTTAQVEKFLARYEHLEAGGLWCEGRPFNGEPWGQLKPNTPVTEEKDKDRFTIYLKNGQVQNLEKPANYKPELKERKYESIPKASQNLPSHRSHFAFAKDLDDIKNETKEVWITEGAKKGAAIYTRGIDAIALNGVNGGYSKDDNEQRYLDGHLKQYNWQSRTVVLCFDKDPPEKTKTLRNVAIAMHRFGRLLEQQGAKVEVAEMPGNDQGKLGIDDWLARGNQLSDLSYSTLDEWAQESPWLEKELAAHEYEMEQEEGFEY